MSRVKYRTMRRLKRVLGVTAIILALLIAAIPDVGRADEAEWVTAAFYVRGDVFRADSTVSLNGSYRLDDDVAFRANKISNAFYKSICDSFVSSSPWFNYELSYQVFTVKLTDTEEEGTIVNGDYLNDMENWGDDISVTLTGNLYDSISDLPGSHVDYYDITNLSADDVANLSTGDRVGFGQYGSPVTFTHKGAGERVYIALYIHETDDSGSGSTDSSTAGTTSSSAAATTSAAAATTSDSGTSSSATGATAASHSFRVNDVACYSYDIGLLHGTGSYGSLNTEPSGEWVLTVTNDSNSSLRSACVKYAGLSSGAAYQGFLFASLTRDGSTATFPEDATMTLTMPLPDSLKDAESVDVRKLAYGSDHTVYPEKVQVQIIPIPDVKDPTNTRNYVQITIPAAKFATATPYAMFATPTEKETDSSSIVMDTPKDSEAEEEVPPDTNREDAIDQIWGVGTPKAEPEGLEAADYRLLITSYNQPSAQQLYKKIVQQAGTTKYNKSKSTIYVYDIRLKKTMNDEITYPETPEELGYGSVKITLPVADNLVEDSKTQRGTVAVYALKDNSGLEVILAPTSASTSVTFTASHFSQYAVLYTKGDKKESSPSEGGSTSSRAASASTTGSSSGSSASTASSAASTATGASSNATTGSSGTGGGGNQASGDQPYSGTGRANTADATTYKAIFILILLAFGAFELVSSLPAKRKAKAKRQ